MKIVILTNIIGKMTTRLFAGIFALRSKSSALRFLPCVSSLESRESPTSADWLGKEGIQSAQLGLTGAGVAVGQVELGRPGIANFDNQWNLKVAPFEILSRDANPVKNDTSLVESAHGTS
jgi:hypothetical protein